MLKRFLILLLGSALLQNQVHAQGSLPAWKEGFLDIHFIETGAGNASFMVFPDGTTMLVDAGDLNKNLFDTKFFPLKSTPVSPGRSKRPGQWISSYIKQVMPGNRKAGIDYALITHYHEDHYGQINRNSIEATNKAYQLSGLTDVDEELPISKLLDRGLDYPVDLRTYYSNNPTFSNYLKFIGHRIKNGLTHEALQAGSSKQICLLFNAEAFPGFVVRNIKSNNNVWSGKDEKTFSCFPDASMPKKDFNENPLSNAIKITYGKFSFYTGGDNTGYEGEAFPGRKNVEPAIAKAVGKITAMSLNHHGNRDANNDVFIKSLSPDVVVQQSWCSDQPGQDLAFRLVEKNTRGDSIAVFNTHMQQETQVYLGAWITKKFKSLHGHVVIRVTDQGNAYQIFVLNENKEKLEVVKTFGPYLTK